MYKPKKELGQNFLLDLGFVRKMVDALDLKNGDEIVEIGPGLGILTEYLSERMSMDQMTVHAVELDDRFVSKLGEMFKSNYSLEVVHADILRWLPTFVPKKDFKILGSLPYYITSPILHTIIRQPVLPEICVLLMQKEVAEKIFETAPNGSYLSNLIHTFYNVELLSVVSKKLFDPSPKVDGGIIKLSKKTQREIPYEEAHYFEGFLHKGFSKPRKMLNKTFYKEMLEKLNIDNTLRPQHLSLSEWLALYKESRISSR